MTVGLARGPQQPNVVLIISDDQAWTDYGFMGHDTIQTPHLDKLAKESSISTRRAYSPLPSIVDDAGDRSVCPPTRRDGQRPFPSPERPELAKAQ